MEWIVFGVLLWLVFSRKGRSLFHGDGPSFRGHHSQRTLDEGSAPGTLPVRRSETVEVVTRTEGVARSAPATQQLSPAQSREEKMRRLRELYVADEITVEEYERRLDELMRENPKTD